MSRIGTGHRERDGAGQSGENCKMAEEPAHGFSGVQGIRKQRGLCRVSFLYSPGVAWGGEIEVMKLEGDPLERYIDDEEWFGDEITPESLHGLLYPEGADAQEDLAHRAQQLRRIVQRGGAGCLTIFAPIRAMFTSSSPGRRLRRRRCWPRRADRLEMTQGSLWMIHDPSVAAWGNERDLAEAIQLLRACKESILNVYGRAAAISPARKLAP